MLKNYVVLMKKSLKLQIVKLFFVVYLLLWCSDGIGKPVFVLVVFLRVWWAVGIDKPVFVVCLLVW